MAKIITRFPPSPTGKFHIGSARTALFNYLFAKHNKGDFLLRFEDTDQERSTKESEEDIKNGMEWLGLKWDGPISHQLNNMEKHLSLALKLVNEGLAYEKEGAIWFKVPQNQRIEFTDLIRGKVVFESKEFSDFVIVRSNKIPIYYFSNAIDDAEDKITHVLRGEEHLSNTPKQIFILEALGYKKPEYGHMPLILNEDRTKLSKRSGSVSLADYKEKGYLPEAIINFLALLGWNPGNEREFFTLEDLIKEFKIERVQKSPAIFNIEKLNFINAHYLRGKTDKELSKEANVSEKMVEIFKERAKTLKELQELSQGIIELKDYDFRLLIFKKSDKKKTKIGLEKTLEILEKQKDWPKAETEFEQILKNIMEENGLSFGDVFWPVRVALSGLEKSPSPTELLWALSKEESLERLKEALKKLS